MNEEKAKVLWGLAKGTLFLLLFIDFGAGVRILTVPMAQGWLIFWVVALTVTYVADLTSFEVLATKSFERKLINLEIVATMVSWFALTLWVGYASFLVLVALVPVAIPSWIVVLSACISAALYFMVKLMCYNCPGLDE